MSWLFCCSNSQQNIKENQSTMDLSKPISTPIKIKPEIQNDLEGLSGKPNEESQKLN